MNKKEFEKSEKLRKKIYGYILEKLNKNWRPEFVWDTKKIKKRILIPQTNKVIIDFCVKEFVNENQIRVAYVYKEKYKYYIERIWLEKRIKPEKIDFKFIEGKYEK